MQLLSLSSNSTGAATSPRLSPSVINVGPSLRGSHHPVDITATVTNTAAAGPAAAAAAVAKTDDDEVLTSSDSSSDWDEWSDTEQPVFTLVTLCTLLICLGHYITSSVYIVHCPFFSCISCHSWWIMRWWCNIECSVCVKWRDGRVIWTVGSTWDNWCSDWFCATSSWRIFDQRSAIFLLFGIDTFVSDVIILLVLKGCLFIDAHLWTSERMWLVETYSCDWLKCTHVIGWNVLMWLVETYSVKIVSLIHVGNIQELPQFPHYGSMISLNVKKMCCIFSKDSSVRVLPMKKAAAMLSVKASPLLAVPNITAHSSTASIPTSYYSTWHYYCLWALKG